MISKAIPEAKVENIADAMRRDHNIEGGSIKIGRTVLLIGAGCSVSAGIPLAETIAKDLSVSLANDYGFSSDRSMDPSLALELLVNNNKFTDSVITKLKNGETRIEWSTVYDVIFTQHYCTPKEIRKIFSNIFSRNDGAINWSHLCIGELVRLGYISTVLTTNFDQLALEGMARAGRLPIVADGPESLNRITGESNQPQLVQIHGSRNTYYLRNSVEDLDEIADSISARHAIDEIIRTASVVIVVGYGGREKGLMKLLIDSGNNHPDTRIYWVLHSKDDCGLSPLAKEFLETSKFSQVLYGQDSDIFFQNLLNALDIPAPKIIVDPLHLVRELNQNLVYSSHPSIEKLIGEHQNAVQDINIANRNMSALLPVEDIDNQNNNAANTQSEKMAAIGQIASGLAHDFNNILTAIIMGSDLLLAQHRPHDPLFSDIMNIKQNANRGVSIIRQLLAFSRRQPAKAVRIDLNGVVIDLKMLLSRLVGSGINLHYDLDNELGDILADVGQIEQVFVNLIVNARDAIDENGNIYIKTRNITSNNVDKAIRDAMIGGEFVHISVKDDGKGIVDADIKHIFEPFFTTKSSGKGTGLGLSMVWGIVKQHNGSIYVKSKQKQGTTFDIYFPKLKESDDNSVLARENSHVKRDSQNLTGTETILIVEDEDAVRRGEKQALESRGYNVIEAMDGLEAFNIFKRSRKSIDLVVSNVVMPNMDGPTLINRIREMEPEIKYILTSGYSEDSIQSKIEKSDNFVFLPKPFSLKQLAKAVRDRLDSDI